MASRSFRVALLALALSAGGCGPRHGTPAPVEYAIIVFNNESLDQTDVYAVGTAGDRVRLGTVFGGHTDSLRLDLRTVSGSGTITVYARVIATGRTPSSGQVLLHPGDFLRVTMPSTENVLNALVSRPAQSDTT
ncbi:MAG: hypothetical protein HOQ11_10745 [Gemmatimonadaceae bacterium]|nr:hypothetical protein [Gemmatimonadaceae bacterium]NUQ94462.1 hypothetical protein [Gemmatimonadaceae bacterium]NUR18558.1 hypothetical protein [Gemmatimonadaceae bacterium]NUS97871.1 hypothetical protein [Gemmatimonadaceae bacterium]